MYRKNTAGQFVYFCLINASNGTALTGATVTAYRALDNGSQATATGTTTELGNGQYRFNLSQADTNANYGSYLFTAIGAVPVEKTVVFTAANPQDAAAFGLSTINLIDNNIDAVNSVVNSLDLRLPATLVGGRMDAHVGAMAANTLTASALATDAVNEIVGAIYGELLDGGSAGTMMEVFNNLDSLRSQLASMIESDGAGQFRFDTIALERAQIGLATQASLDTKPTLAQIEASTVIAKESTLTAIKGATFDTATDSLEAIRDQGDTAWVTGGGLGEGARTVTITVRDSLAAAVENAMVRVTRTGETFAGTTNASGVIVFNLDDATWTVSITATGLSFAGASLVVDGTEAVTYTLTAAGGGVTPSTPPLTTGFWTVYDNLGAPQAGAQVSIQASSPPRGSTGIVMEDAVRTATADGSGVVQFSNLIKGATYTVYRTSSYRKFSITVPATAGDTVALGSIVG